MNQTAHFCAPTEKYHACLPAASTKCRRAQLGVEHKNEAGLHGQVPSDVGRVLEQLRHGKSLLMSHHRKSKQMAVAACKPSNIWIGHNMARTLGTGCNTLGISHITAQTVGISHNTAHTSWDQSQHSTHQWDRSQHSTHPWDWS